MTACSWSAGPLRPSSCALNWSRWLSTPQLLACRIPVLAGRRVDMRALSGRRVNRSSGIMSCWPRMTCNSRASPACLAALLFRCWGRLWNIHYAMTPTATGRRSPRYIRGFGRAENHSWRCPRGLSGVWLVGRSDKSEVGRDKLWRSS